MWGLVDYDGGHGSVMLDLYEERGSYLSYVYKKEILMITKADIGKLVVGVVQIKDPIGAESSYHTITGRLTHVDEVSGRIIVKNRHSSLQVSTDLEKFKVLEELYARDTSRLGIGELTEPGQDQSITTDEKRDTAE